MAKTTKTREEWLNAVALEMAPWFDGQGYPLPRFRVSIGFTSKGRRGRRIGECWDNRCSADQVFEILIRPDQAESVDVAAILAHELVHAAVGLKCGHKGPFRIVARGIGLEGKMTATVPGEAFREAFAPILDKVGPLPHARLNFSGQSTTPKKQKTNLLKAHCTAEHEESGQVCGYTVRVTRVWVEGVGAPCCPLHGAMHVEMPEDEATDPVPEGEQEAA